MTKHKASIVWEGGTGPNQGVIIAEGGVRSANRNAAHRHHPAPVPHPDEQLATAHAVRFSLALAQELTRAGFSARRIRTTATVMSETRAAGGTTSGLELDVVAAVPGATQMDFIPATLRAKANYPASRLLDAGITMNARLIA